MDGTKPTSGEPEKDPDRFLPQFLLPHMPANPDIRDAIMGTVAIVLSGSLGIAGVYLIHEWIGLTIMSTGIGYFTVHYWWRIWVRYYRRKRDNADGQKAKRNIARG
jgi:hypothetical protein